MRAGHGHSWKLEVKRTRTLRMARLVMAGAGLAAATGWVLAQDKPTSVIWRDVMPGHWQWMEDYAFLSATYVVGCPHDRKCRVGTGMFVAGSPRGSEKEFSGDTEVTVFGLGSLHVRVEDGSAAARVGFYRRSSMLIPIYPPPGSGLIPPSKP